MGGGAGVRMSAGGGALRGAGVAIAPSAPGGGVRGVNAEGIVDGFRSYSSATAIIAGGGGGTNDFVSGASGSVVRGAMSSGCAPGLPSAEPSPSVPATSAAIFGPGADPARGVGGGATMP